MNKKDNPKIMVTEPASGKEDEEDILPPLSPLKKHTKDMKYQSYKLYHEKRMMLRYINFTFVDLF